MTRPSIVRADTIDLQDRAAPSAKDHHAASVRVNNFAPHQAETLREVAEEAAEAQARSPRISVTDGNGVDLQQYAEELTAGAAGALNTGKDTMPHQEHEDPLAAAQNGGISSSDEGDLDGDEDLDDDMMDRISSSPSIDDEDIDFNFVYALHTFVATVEGQANATKGDTMALLDDSNSYWWLVRVIKDSSIGYLPAEHIETPTERLARLNKHRNVDLSASMLGDQASKQKTTFKAIRKRKKNVTFAEPTYVNYQDPDFSTDEEDIEELFGKQPVSATQKIEQQREEEEQQKQKKEAETADDSGNDTAEKGLDQEQAKAKPTRNDDEPMEEAAKVQPLKTRTKESKLESTKEEASAELAEDGRGADEDEFLDSQFDPPRQSKNGTLRNTDSFFKDETAETKRITLTPNLLRDDGAPRPSNDSMTRDMKSRTSLDKLEKELRSDKDTKKSKDKEKKEKEKKSGGLRGFFSRGSKKKSGDEDDDSGKRSMDAGSEPRESEDQVAAEHNSSDKTASAPRGKLQKVQPRTEPSPTRRPSVGQGSQKQFVDYGRTNDISTVPPSSMRIVDPETREVQEIPSSTQFAKDQNQQERSASAASRRDDQKLANLMSAPRSASAGPEYRTSRGLSAKSRMQLDDSDHDILEEVSEEDEEDVRPNVKREVAEAPQKTAPEPVSAPTQPSSERPLRPQLPGAFPDSYISTSTVSSDRTVLAPPGQIERLSESPVEVSPISPSDPPALMGDSSSQEPVSPADSPSPELVQVDDSSKDGLSMDSAKEPSWDDSKLRQFFDEGEQIRDLLLVVYDKTDVVPAGKDHPVVGGLFREQNAKLAEITTQLDNMLGDWLARKQRRRGAL